MKAALSWLALLAYMGALFVLSGIPQPSMPKMFAFTDKIAHAAAYFGLCLAARLPANTLFRRRGYAILFAFLVSTLYGAADELRQSLTPGRVPDIQDWTANAVGAGCAAALMALTALMRGKERSEPCR